MPIGSYGPVMMYRTVVETDPETFRSKHLYFIFDYSGIMMQYNWYITAHDYFSYNTFGVMENVNVYNSNGKYSHLIHK